MGTFWNAFFGFILIVVWIAAGVYITRASILLGHLSTTDNNFSQAYNFAFWAAFVTWFLVALAIILVILAIVGIVALFSTGIGEAAEAGEIESSLVSGQQQQLISTGLPWVTIGFLLLAFALVVTTGILSAEAAAAMKRSPHFSDNNQNMVMAYDDAIISAIIALSAAGFLVLGVIIYYIVEAYNRNKAQAQAEYVDKQKNIEISQIEQLKKQADLKAVQDQLAFQEQVKEAQRQALLRRIRSQ